jgi:uncharacterized protein
VHISQLSNTYVSDPNTVVKLQQKVMVTVMEVDIARKRISLSMKGAAVAAPGKSAQAGGAGRQGAQAGAGRGQGKVQEKKVENPDAFQAKLLELKKKFKD